VTSELCDFSARALVDGLGRGDFSAVEVLASTFARIDAVEGRRASTAKYEMVEEDLEKVHAFITITRERAMAQAEEIDRKIAAGEDPGPLAGVPLAVKDIFCARGTPSTAGSKILENFVAPYSATPVDRLESAGAITIGKVNLDEFTFGSSNESSAFLPPVGNPWNPRHVPGGSSGGSAAAVAAGEAVISLGTDTAGSIRQPASFCGVVGMKPTYGRVSRYGLIAFASSLDCPGPVARDVTDTALMMNAIAGPDIKDATTANTPVPDYLENLKEDIKGLRIGLSPDYFRIKHPDPESGEIQEQPITPEVEASVHAAAEAFAAEGAEIVENVSLPNSQFGVPVYFVISRVEAASNLHRYDGVKYGYRSDGDVGDLREQYRRTRGQGFGLQPKLRILMGMYVSAEQYEKGYYERALRIRTRIRGDFEAVFDPEGDHKLDCLLTPTTPTTAFKLGEVYGDTVLMQYADLLTVPANLAGIPGLSLPSGVDSNGLPVGIQLLGPDYTEAMLLRVGRSYERATRSEPWRDLKPAVLKNL
jgi:aspartyl-tRNA(Asn)/glutamyl-tRNA(Gln) amidotransferase subunit A